MTACPSCIAFAKNPRTHSFNARCLECTARSIAGSPAYFNAAAAKNITPVYKATLQRAFAGDWMRGHERVKHYAGLIEKAKVEA